MISLPEKAFVSPLVSNKPMVATPWKEAMCAAEGCSSFLSIVMEGVRI